MSFTGTQQKCKACEKTVYPVELLSADGVSYHKSCFKCSHCKGTLKVASLSLIVVCFLRSNQGGLFLLCCNYLLYAALVLEEFIQDPSFFYV